MRNWKLQVLRADVLLIGSTLCLDANKKKVGTEAPIRNIIVQKDIHC